MTEVRVLCIPLEINDGGGSTAPQRYGTVDRAGAHIETIGTIRIGIVWIFR